MVSEDEYQEAVKQHDSSQKVINQYHKEKQQAFKKRMEENPVFTEDELVYSARDLCPCGYGIAYPKDCGPSHYWDCSGILRGIADDKVEHVGKLPFAFYEIKSESQNRGTTRGVFRPMKEATC